MRRVIEVAGALPRAGMVRLPLAERASVWLSPPSLLTLSGVLLHQPASGGILSPQMQAALPDRYQIVRELGHSGMATVFLAQPARVGSGAGRASGIGRPGGRGDGGAGMGAGGGPTPRFPPVSAGDPAEPDGRRALARLYLLHPSSTYTPVFAGLVQLERARIHQRLGQVELASSSYLRFLRLYDRPLRRHLPLVEEARSRSRTPSRTP